MGNLVIALFRKCFKLDQQVHVEEVEESVKHPRDKLCEAALCILNPEMPLAAKIEAAYDVGTSGFTAGYAVAKEYSRFISFMVDALQLPNLLETQRIKLLQALSCICYTHAFNQFQACRLGLLSVLKRFLTGEYALTAKEIHWSCYLLDILCCDNVFIIRTLVKVNLLECLEELVPLDWTGWPQNHADSLKRLITLLRIYRPAA